MSKDINDSLIKFLTNPENKILVLKGKWGIGKTYFWKSFFEDNNPDNTAKLSDDKKQIISNVLPNYSYVSLFGISNLNELKNKIFISSNPIKLRPSIWNGSITKEKIFISAVFLFILFLIFTPSLKMLGVMAILAFLITFWFDHFKHLSFWINLFKRETYKNIDKQFFSLKNAGKFLDHINKLAIIKKYIGDSSNFIINNYIEDMLICFDDIERINDKFSIQTLMGYVDELAQQKNCKVLLIFNENELGEEQKKAFNKYREKIVDIELTYSPTLEQQLAIVFAEQLDEYPIISKIIKNNHNNGFNIKNIRVLQKIRIFFNAYLNIIPENTHPLITDEFIKHLVLLSHCYYELNDKIPFELIRNNELGIELITEEHNTDKYDKNVYEQIIEIRKALNIPHSSKLFTVQIIHMLEHGIWNSENISTDISNEIKNKTILEKKYRIKTDLNQYVRLYRGNFQDCRQEIVSSFERVLTNNHNYQYIEPRDFLYYLSEYTYFKKMIEPEFIGPLNLIDEYITINTNTLEKYTFKDYRYFEITLGHINNEIKEYALTKIDSIRNSKNNIPIQELVKTLKPSGINHEQKNYILSLSVEDIYDWLKSANDPDIFIHIDSLRTWSAPYNERGILDLNANTPINQAIEKLKKENPLNADRFNRMLNK